MLNKAYIDLEQIKQNALLIKSKLPEKTKFCAVVKDDAYGHGAVAVASALYKIVDSYAVALVEEGLALRLGGIDKDILVLIPCFESDLESAINQNLTLTVQSLKDLMRISRWCEKLKKNCKVHIKFNSGMNRQGVDDVEELQKLCDYIVSKRRIILEGVYSHFSKPESKRIRKNQLNNFLLAIKACKGYNNNVISHISASGGFLKEEYFDMVRIGILLYGYTPFKCSFPVKPCLKVEVPIIKKVALKPFQSALYGNKRTLKKGELSLIRFGYGDGLKRERGEKQFSNKCMDLSLVKDNGSNGNVYFIDFEKLSKKYKTISYALLTDITKRCEKIYGR